MLGSTQVWSVSLILISITRFSLVLQETRSLFVCCVLKVMVSINSAYDLKRLASLSTRASFQEVVILAQQIKAFYDRPIDIENVGKFEMSVGMIDNTALMVLPKEDWMNDIKPVITRGDGNCLFNAASIAICKRETLSVELRLRTALELLINADFYGSHPIVSSMHLTTMSGKKWPKEGLYEAVIFSNRASRILAEEGFQRALQEEIYNTLYDGRYSGIIQMMGLSSATGCEIKLVYPDKKHSLLPLLSASYGPRVGDSHPPRITIMMTDMSGWPDRSKEFKVIHFVPMIKFEPSNTSNEWIKVTRKRHTTGTTRSSPDMKKARSFSRKSTTKVTLQDFFPSIEKSRTQATPTKSARSPHTPMHSPPSKSQTPKDRHPSKPHAPSKQDTPMDSHPSKLQKPMDMQPNSSPMCTNSLPSSLQTPKESSSGIPQTPMESRPSSSHKPNISASSSNLPSVSNTAADLDLPEVGNLSKDYSSALPLQKPMDMQPNSSPMCTNSLPSSLQTPKESSSGIPQTPMESRPSSSHKPNISASSSNLPSVSNTAADLDLPEVGNLSKDYSSALPLCVGRSFYKKRGDLYQKNSARRNDFQAQRKTNEMLECRRSKVAGTLQENVNYLKTKIRFSNPKILPSLLGTLAVAEHILKHGPLVATTELCVVYQKANGTVSERRMMAAELFGIVTKHLNVMQLYIQGQAFMSENTTSDFQSLVSFINNQKQSRKQFNDSVEDIIGGCFNEALQYMDSKRDRDTVIALMERLTSVNFVAKKLRNVQNKKAVQGCRDAFTENLRRFRDIKETSRVMRNDMTNEQQRTLTLRIANKRKLKEILHASKGRGRTFKCEENPMLVPLLEYAFLEGDIERGGGGLQSHPRLIEDTLYRTPQNNTDMKRARELIIALSNPDFKISLSCCYNYTQNYKKNTMQAKRHHDGKGINAKIPLHNAPRVGVQKFVINTHWSCANVNFVVDDCAANVNNCVVDSKDAKSIVPGDIAPVQNPMKMWKQRSGILPDHDWEQGRQNAVTPMAHLFLESKAIIETPMPIEQVTIPLLDSTLQCQSRERVRLLILFICPIMNQKLFSVVLTNSFFCWCNRH